MMEAKDTVMSSQRLDKEYWKWQVAEDIVIPFEEWVSQAQAEISFKAGYDEALTQLAEMTEECKQMGRKEVVEWLERARKIKVSKYQLKEWGL